MRLHETMRVEPAKTAAFALQGYGEGDLAVRRQLLEAVREALAASGG